MAKKYCIFSAQYYPHVGGVERYTLYLGKRLIADGNEVTVVTSNTGGLESVEMQDGIRIMRFPCYDLLGGRYPFFKRNKEFKKIEKTLQAQEFDAVIINTRFYLHSLYGAKYAYKKKIPAIVIEHGTSHLSVNNALFDKLGAVYEHFLTWVLKKYCKDYYGVSEACCEWSGHFHIRSKGTLYNAVDINEIREIGTQFQMDYRKQYQIPENAKIITFTGRLIPEKGILQLTEAVRRINEKRRQDGQEPVYLMIAGDGALKEKLEQQAEEHILLLGQIDFNHIVKLLQTSDIFCLPSDSEGFPTSVLEAVACRCFVITTFQGGAKELILDRDHGIIMDGNTVEQIQENLEFALNDPDYCEKAVEKAYERLQEHFTWEATADKVQKIFTD